jgi:hypothetical protein
MPRTVRQGADPRFPPSTRIGVRHYLTEWINNLDSPAHWVQVVNDLYEHRKPPMLHDSWATPVADTDAFPAWRLPTVHMGTHKSVSGSDAEKISSIFQMRRASGSGPVQARLNNVTQSQEPSFVSTSSTSFDFVGPALVPVDDDPNIGHVLVELEFRAPPGATAEARSVTGRFANDRTALPPGPYGTDFLPFLVELLALHEGVSVPTMERLIVDLVELKRRRSPGMICTRYFPDGCNSAEMLRGFAWQQEHVTSATFIVDAQQDGGAGNVIVSLTGDGVARTETVPITTGTVDPYMVTFALPRHSNPGPRGLVLSVQTGGANRPLVWGVNGWFNPITASLV